jgi:hypothetical protein
LKRIDVLKSPRSIEYSSETCIKTFQTKNVFLQLFARESTNLQILNSKRRMQSGHVSIFIQTSLTGVEWNSNAKCFVKQKKNCFAWCCCFQSGLTCSNSRVDKTNCCSSIFEDFKFFFRFQQTIYLISYGGKTMPLKSFYEIAIFKNC